EGVAIRDVAEAPRVVIGANDEASGDALQSVYQSQRAPIVRTSLRMAEMVKCADNAFHALKVAFANEIGSVCRAIGLDSRALMEIFALDTRLNLSDAYLTPGYAFGGSCLPKDLRALIRTAQELQVDAPLLPAVLASNERHKQRAFELVQGTGRKAVAVLGLAFKEGSDDLRESPAVELVARLLSEGYRVVVYDANVFPSTLVGSNREYSERRLPTLPSLMRPTLAAALTEAEVVV